MLIKRQGVVIFDELFDKSRYVNHVWDMANIKISSKVDEAVWEELKPVAQESHQNISGLLTEALRGYLQRHRVHPFVEGHLNDSIGENEELGELLAK